MLMTQILSDIVMDVRTDFMEDLPDSVRFERWFDEIQGLIALRCECIDANLQRPVDGYLSETGLIADSSTTTLAVRSNDFDDVATADYYNGWKLTNTDLYDWAFVVDTVPSGGYQTLSLSKAISDQASGDTFKIERLSQYVDLPWYFIRPRAKRGVVWGTRELSPGSLSEIKNMYNRGLSAGTPYEYALEFISGSKCRLWLNPYPSSTDFLYVFGARKPAVCFEGVTTSAGASNGTSLVATDIPLQETDYYVGSQIMIKSGTYTGEVRTISSYTPATGTLLFETPFSGQIATSVDYELVCGLGEEFRPIIRNYILSKVYSTKAALLKIAKVHEADYMNSLEEMETLWRRRQTAKVEVANSYRRSRNVTIITS